jgi:hypothetical protein
MEMIVMTIEEVRARVNAIGALRGNPEAALASEVELRADFLAYLAERNDEIGEMAREISRTDALEFPR